MKDLLSTEVSNRFSQLPEAEKTPWSMVRIAVEVTRELEEDGPEAVDTFLRMFESQGGLH